ncbi:hypothetical protein B0O80DRAFT_477071 [Mortierella sp. GBAus27b]|nr:hypothetical protein B0O80DRAFT_477071 [Mortierella sp. GBAus27b]
MLCNPKSNQEKMSSIWSRPCRACLYIASRPVPIGDGVTHAVPIHKGFTLTHEVQIVDLAGSDLTDHLLKSLEGHDYTLPFVQRKLSRRPQDATLSSTNDKSYELLCDQIVTISAERFHIPNIYGNIVVAGGTTIHPGFVDRVLNEITAVSSTILVQVVTPPECDSAAWIAGSSPASPSTPKDKWCMLQE